MCTGATYTSKNHYFGRNLDYDFSYGETAVIIPRNFPFYFREAGLVETHYAITGIAFISDVPADALVDGEQKSYPLLYDAINEKGLGMAGLLFANNAVFNDHVDGKDNIAQFEFLPWILGRCANLDEVKSLLANINLRNLAFSPELPPSELHWLITDLSGASIVVESVADGLKVYDNPIGILTNNPTFDKHLMNLSNYQHLSAKNPVNNFAPNYNFPIYSRGMGAIGLPGDLSSESRFVKASFTKLNSRSDSDELSSVSQFFHILHSVDQQNGCCDLGDNHFEHTLYSSCYNLEEGIFYYTTYNNHQITALSLSKSNLDDKNFSSFPLIETEQVNYLN